MTLEFLRRSVALIAVLALAPVANGYSVLTHEQIVDLAWKGNIAPLLMKRFPQTTPEELKRAHAFAYGGSVIQDLGYYPFGSKQFSDLVHYVRSGDFVENLLNDAKDVNEYAFALGALSHYSSDLSGHPAVNRAVAIEFPKLRAKYGDVVTYEDNPKAHLSTEFGFDVTQVAKNRYTADAYHDFIGFEVAKPLLERAFQKTYGMELGDVFKSVDLAIGSYRRSVSSVIPEMTKVALATRKADLVRETPNFEKREFLYHLSGADYEKEWGKSYEHPGIGARILAFLFRMVPKIGPLRGLDYKVPSRKTEDLYVASVNDTIEKYDDLLRKLRAGEKIELPNMDFDTGKETFAGEYRLTDEAYSKLIRKLDERKFDLLTSELRDDVLQFYADPKAQIATKKDAEQWQKTLDSLRALKATTAVAIRGQ
ncbi:MAG: zinc dependent phospholipase C family protein [Terriglobales bacterium]